MTGLARRFTYRSRAYDTKREAPVGIEPTNRGFADLCLTTWLRRRAEVITSHGRSRFSTRGDRGPDARQSLHRSEDHREVFVTVRGELPGVLRGGYLHGCSRRG